MKDCIFCKIAKREIPKEFYYEDDDIMVFSDINPRAPIHLLIVPKEHIVDFFFADQKTHMVITEAIKKLIDKEKLMGKGYRITVNGGGAQDINHLHFHIISPLAPYDKI